MMDKSQIGRAGELAIELYVLVTSGGEVDIYAPVVDDDHVDLVAGIRGGDPTLGIQVKTAPSLDRSGVVEARASYPLGHVRDDHNFLYAVVLLDAVRIETMWSSAVPISTVWPITSPKAAERYSSSAVGQAATTRSGPFGSTPCRSGRRSSPLFRNHRIPRNGSPQ